jgi:hypothetical protein
MRVGDARLLAFPAMLVRVRERVMGALAGVIDELDPTDEAGEAADAAAGFSPLTRRRRRPSRSFAAAGATVASLSEALLAQ